MLPDFAQFSEQAQGRYKAIPGSKIEYELSKEFATVACPVDPGDSEGGQSVGIKHVSVSPSLLMPTHKGCPCCEPSGTSPSYGVRHSHIAVSSTSAIAQVKLDGLRTGVRAT